MKAAIELKQTHGHYEVYWYGSFYCTCDPDEVTAVLAELEAREKEETDGKSR